MVFDYEGYNHFGVWGREEADYFNSYFNSKYEARFERFIPLNVRGMSNYDVIKTNKERKKDKIIELLENDIPVALEIGWEPKYLFDDDSGIYRHNKMFKPGENGFKDNEDDQFQFERVKYNYGPKAGKDYAIKAHWMTITEIIIDDCVNKKWIAVQNWGAKEYFDFDAWVENQSGTIADGILTINKKV